MGEQEDKYYKLLRLLYTIQKNGSNAVKKIQAYAKAIEERRICFDGVSRYWIECVQCADKVQNSHFVRGHRHKMFNADEVEKMKIMCMKGVSNRKIAKEMKCSEATIRNYRKKSDF